MVRVSASSTHTQQSSLDTPRNWRLPSSNSNLMWVKVPIQSAGAEHAPHRVPMMIIQAALAIQNAPTASIRKPQLSRNTPQTWRVPSSPQTWVVSPSSCALPMPPPLLAMPTCDPEARRAASGPSSSSSSTHIRLDHESCCESCAVAVPSSLSLCARCWFLKTSQANHARLRCLSAEKRKAEKQNVVPCALQLLSEAASAASAA
mmetsp:Transcript_18332/g.39437  ORF Transcript_18332/g.39437 Transcript_18332/m.39437 type:complete len:204 (+) Transcript_18332:58-669(+)